MEEQIQDAASEMIGKYGWMFISGMLFLLFKSSMESQFSISSKVNDYHIVFENSDYVLNLEDETVEEIKEKVHSMVKDILEKKYSHLGEELFQEWQMMVYLQILNFFG